MYGYLIFMALSVAALSGVLQAIDHPRTAGHIGIWSMLGAGILLFIAISTGAGHTIGFILAFAAAYWIRDKVWNFKQGRKKG